MPTYVQSYGELIATLNYFKKEIEACDTTHNQAYFFDLMKSFRRVVGSVHDKDICTPFFHSEEYQGYKDFFRYHNNYYVRALEATAALDMISL